MGVQTGILAFIAKESLAFPRHLPSRHPSSSPSKNIQMYRVMGLLLMLLRITEVNVVEEAIFKIILDNLLLSCAPAQPSPRWRSQE